MYKAHYRILFFLFVFSTVLNFNLFSQGNDYLLTIAGEMLQKKNF